MSKNKLELLFEALKDMAKDTDTVHYTNFIGLLGILRDGKLKAQNYRDKAKENTVEVAALRRSKDRYLQAMKRNDNERYKKETAELSENVGSIKIYLHSNRIKASLPNVNKKPISEFYIYSVRELDGIYKKIKKIYEKYDASLSEDKFKSLIKQGLKEVENKIGLENLKNEKKMGVFIPVVENIVKDAKLNISNNDTHNTLLRHWENALHQGRYLFYSSSMGREAEERFTFGEKSGKDLKNVGIPVNPLYMKIRIVDTDDLFDEFEYCKNEGLLERFIEMAIELLENIKKHEKVFLRDDVFLDFVKKLQYVVKHKNI